MIVRGTWRCLGLMPAFAALVGMARADAGGELRTQRFDGDPAWEAHNNRSAVPEPRSLRQDFGYSSRTAHAGGGPGEIGGLVSPAAEPAYYARRIGELTLDQPFSASGILSVSTPVGEDGGAGNTLIGLFNAGTVNEWRTPNSLAIRVNGRGDVFHAHLEYTTRRWRSGGEFLGQVDPATGKKTMRGIPGRGLAHRWSLKYDPQGNQGGGAITLTLDGEPLVLNLDPGHRADGAVFNRFGILNVMKSADSGGEVWLDDLTLNGVTDRFERDPRWEGRGNRRTYVTRKVRPRFDFGFSPTRYAGGERAGELGGLIFRGDCRYPERMAYYADRLEPLSLDRAFQAAGKVCLRRGVTDSTVLIGFFNASQSAETNPSQDSGIPRSFLGAAIEGPSREGFFFYPLYRTSGSSQADGSRSSPPRIYPDGKPHDWSLDYTPTTADGEAQVRLRLDGQETVLKVPAAHRPEGARFDRFGIITTWIDGNGQDVYLDDLRYTWRQ